MIIIETNFEGANAEKIKVSGNTVSFHVCKNTSPYGMWFYFRVKKAKGQMVLFRMENLSETLGSQGWKLVLPVVSSDRKKWRRIPSKTVRILGNHEVFSFEVFFRTNSAYVAYCYPYTYSQSSNFLRRAEKHSFAQLEVLGKTAGGRHLYHLVISEPSIRKKGAVWVIAREHAGEVSGSYVFEGMVQFLLKNSPQAQKLRKLYEFHFIPMVDVDGVAEGRYGKQSKPVCFARAWTEKSLRIEIQQVIQKIQEVSSRISPLFFLNLHSPGPNHVTFAVPVNPSVFGIKAYQDPIRYFGLVRYFLPDSRTISVQDCPDRAIDWFDEDLETNARWFMGKGWGIPAFTLETTYHVNTDGKYATRSWYRDLGKATILAMNGFLNGQRPHGWRPKSSPFPLDKNWIVWKRPAKATISYLKQPSGIRIHPEGKGASVMVSPNRTFPATSRMILSFEYKSLFSMKEGYLRVLLYGKEGFRLPHFLEFPLKLRTSYRWKKIIRTILIPRGTSSVRPSFHITNPAGIFFLRRVKLQK